MNEYKSAVCVQNPVASQQLTVVSCASPCQEAEGFVGECCGLNWKSGNGVPNESEDWSSSEKVEMSLPSFSFIAFRQQTYWMVSLTPRMSLLSAVNLLMHTQDYAGCFLFKETQSVHCCNNFFIFLLGDFIKWQ